jgi:hypothetical protein
MSVDSVASRDRCTHVGMLASIARLCVSWRKARGRLGYLPRLQALSDASVMACMRKVNLYCSKASTEPARCLGYAKW